MSMESAKAFTERMKNDEEFRTKVNECKDAEARMKYVKDAGFTFTKEDIELSKAELSDHDMSSIVGGDKACITDFHTTCIRTNKII